MLAPNLDKTQFLLTSNLTREENSLAIMRLDHSVTAQQFLACVKYLGIFLGRDHSSANWDPVLHDYIATAKFISSLDCGLMTKISLYNMLAISKLAYVASFVIPNKAALKAEHRALQLLTRGPWNSFHPSLVKNVKALGMPTQAIDLTNLSLASRVRIAHKTSNNVLSCHHDVSVLFASNELVLEFLDMKYLSSNCIETISSGLEFILSRFVLDDFAHFSRKDVYV